MRKMWLRMVLLTVVLALACAVPSLAWSELPPLPERPVFSEPDGGWIAVRVWDAPEGVTYAEVWTVVQWQDGLGDWHDVEAWQGQPDVENEKLWFVAEEDLGKGPFRWVAYVGGEELGASEAFDLPAVCDETVWSDIDLTP